MVTKSQRSKATERIERVKRKYRVGESAADGMLTRVTQRLIASPYTLSVLTVLALCVLGLWLA